MVLKRIFGPAAALLVALHSRTVGAAVLEPHLDVVGPDVVDVEVRRAAGSWQPVAWDSLAETKREPGSYELRLRLDARDDARAVRIPACAGRRRIVLDGRGMSAQPAGPVVVPLSHGPHEVVLAVEVSAYEARIACGERPRFGSTWSTVEGLGSLSYPSPHAALGGGRAVVYVPPGHDMLAPAALLVGAHPWNGSMWTYAAYAPLLGEARAHDVLLLMPSGLGNSLYVADAEGEFLRAIEALSTVLRVDPRAVSIWGASMGGAGATTIALHHPDRFASVTSFFGDSKYDLSTYVHAILPDEAAAHRVNALDVVDNARNLVVFLVHGEDDKTSPVRQSEMLASAIHERGFAVRFERVPHVGHSGALVARFLPEVIALAATTRAPANPPRVTYRSTRPSDTGAYGVRIARALPQGDAFVDIEGGVDAVRIRRAEGVRGVTLAPGALGTNSESPPAIVDETHSVDARWEARP